MAYRTAARRHEHAETVKGSRFIALVAPVGSEAEAERVIAEARAAHPGANHHVYAYRVGEVMRFSDDGEPGGTAGRPMLEVLLKRGLDRVAAVVTRYFGGVKLGAGGLARAYGGTLAKALDEAGVREVLPRAALRFAVPFAEMDAVHRLLDGWSGLEKGEPGYGEDGLLLEVSLLERDLDALRAALGEVTRGQVRWLEARAT